MCTGVSFGSHDFSWWYLSNLYPQDRYCHWNWDNLPDISTWTSNWNHKFSVSKINHNFIYQNMLFFPPLYFSEWSKVLVSSLPSLSITNRQPWPPLTFISSSSKYFPPYCFHMIETSIFFWTYCRIVLANLIFHFRLYTSAFLP